MGKEITVNGRKEKIRDGMSVAQLLRAKNLRLEIVAVEINGQVIERDDYATLKLRSGDVMEFLYYMAGGKA